MDDENIHPAQGESSRRVPRPLKESRGTEATIPHARGPEPAELGPRDPDKGGRALVVAGVSTGVILRMRL